MELLFPGKGFSTVPRHELEVRTSHLGASCNSPSKTLANAMAEAIGLCCNFSLQLVPGVLGLLGPNGAGKTTLIILATITRATAGRVVWNGADLAMDADALRSTLGYLPQDFGVYPNLNAVEFLEYLAAVKGLDAASAKNRIDALLNLVNLADVRKRPLGTYSGGMKQRIGIAQALLNDPQLL